MKWVFLLVMTLLLSPGSTVVFIVLDSGKIPIEGAEISFCDRRAVTDAAGKATFKDIPDLSNTPLGGCTLEIRKEGYLPIVDAFLVTKDVELTYIMYSDEMVTISGIICFDTSDNPQPFVQVRIFDALTGESLPSVLTDGEGRFSFEISKDRLVYVIVSDYENQKFYLTQGKEQILVVSTKGIASDVKISVRDTLMRPLENVSVTLKSGSLTYEGETDARGVVIIKDVPHGEYTISLEKEGYSTFTQPVGVTSTGTGVNEMNFTLERATGTVTLRVFSASGDVSSTVIITSEGKERARIPVTGTETITLETGTYTLEVTAPGFEPGRRQVIILEGLNKKVDLELQKSERIVKVPLQESSLPLLLVTGAALFLFLLSFFYLRRR